MAAIEEEPAIYVSCRIWFHRLTIVTGCGCEWTRTRGLDYVVIMVAAPLMPMVREVLAVAW